MNSPFKKVKSKRVVSITCCVLLSTVLVMTLLTTPASAFFFDDWFGEDYWQPPERTDDMDISDRDYVDLWGEISLYDEGDGQYDEFRDILSARTGPTGLTRIAEYAGGYVPNPTPRSHTAEWNENVHKHSQEGYVYEYKNKYEYGYPNEGTHFIHKETGERYEVVVRNTLNDNYPGFYVTFFHPVDEPLNGDVDDANNWRPNNKPDGVIGARSNNYHIGEKFEWTPKPGETPEVIEDGRQYPPEDNVQSSDFINTVFTDIVTISPHTYYERGAEDVDNISDPPEPVMYIPKSPSLSITSNQEIDLPDNYITGEGLSRTRYTYSLNDSTVSLNVTARNETADATSIESELETEFPRDLQTKIKEEGTDEDTVDRIENKTGVNITAQNITSNVVDHQKTSSTTSTVDLNLNDLEAEKKVGFESELYVWAMKDEDVYERECTEWNTTADPDKCVSSTWNHSHTNTYNDSIHVDYDHEQQGTIYDPVVNVTYNSYADGNVDTYMIDVKNTQPIAGIRPLGDNMARYPVSMYSFSSPEYRNSFGQVTPVEHRALPTGSTIDESRVSQSSATGSGSISYYNTPDKVTLNVDETTVREIDSARIHGVTNNFNPHNVEAVPIVPDSSPTVNTEDGQNQEFNNLELQARYAKGQWWENTTPSAPSHGDHEFESEFGDRTFTATVHVSDTLTNQPIYTKEEEDLDLYVHHGGTGETMKIETEESWQEINIPFKNRPEGEAVPIKFELHLDGEVWIETEIKFTLFDLDQRRGSSSPDDNEINIVSTNLDATYNMVEETDEDEPNVYEVEISLTHEDTGDPLITDGNPHYEIVASQNAENLQKVLQTNVTGQTKTTFEAYPGDYIDIQLEQLTPVYEQQENALAPSSTTISFNIGIDGIGSANNILIYIIQLAIPLSGLILLLSLITKGLTGNWYPK